MTEIVLNIVIIVLSLNFTQLWGRFYNFPFYEEWLRKKSNINQSFNPVGLISGNFDLSILEAELSDS